jgi:hypothetical protein
MMKMIETVLATLKDPKRAQLSWVVEALLIQEENRPKFPNLRIHPDHGLITKPFLINTVSPHQSTVKPSNPPHLMVTIRASFTIESDAGTPCLVLRVCLAAREESQLNQAVCSVV